MIITITTISNECIHVDVEESSNIDSVKTQIAEIKGVSKDLIKLIYKGKEMPDNLNVSEIEITPKTKIILFIKKVGNIPSKKTVEKPKPEPVPEKIEELPKEENKTKHSDISITAPLPLFDAEEKFNDPPEFETKVKLLMDLGYEEGDCKKALRAAVYNTDAAAGFLLSGHIPDIVTVPKEPELTDNNEINDLENLSEEEKSHAQFRKTINELYRHPEKIAEFMSMMEQAFPEDGPMIRKQPEMFLTQIGIDPSRFDLSLLTPKSEYQKLMEEFTEEQKQSIHRLEELGFDTMMVIQVFSACGCDEETAKSCLIGMR